jgi:hypothetical protein
VTRAGGIASPGEVSSYAKTSPGHLSIVSKKRAALASKSRVVTGGNGKKFRGYLPQRPFRADAETPLQAESPLPCNVTGWTRLCRRYTARKSVRPWWRPRAGRGRWNNRGKEVAKRFGLSREDQTTNTPLGCDGPPSYTFQPRPIFSHADLKLREKSPEIICPVYCTEWPRRVQSALIRSVRDTSTPLTGPRRTPDELPPLLPG